MEASKKIAALGGGKSGYCLRGGPGATNGYMMIMANEYGSNDWFDKDGNCILNKPEAVAGLQFLVDMYKNGYVSKDSVNWGFNEIVAGFYSGTCAMLDQDPDALIAIAEKMPKEDFAVAPMPLGPHGKSFPTIGYAGWAMFAASQHKEDAWKLIASLSSSREQPRMVEVRGRHPDPQGCRQGPVLRHRAVQGLVHRAQRPALGADRDADLPRGVRLLRRRDRRSRAARRRCSASAPPRDVAGEWAKYLSDAQKKWLADALSHVRPTTRPRERVRAGCRARGLGRASSPTTMSGRALILIALVMIVPLIVGIGYSFQNVQILNPFKTGWVGLAALSGAGARPGVLARAATTRVWWTFGSLAFQFALGLGLALLLSEPFFGRKLVQALVFLPWAVPSFLSGLAWAWLFNPIIGPLPHWLFALGRARRARQHPGRSRDRHVGADHRQCLVGHAVLRDHAAGGDAGDPGRDVRGGGDRRRRRRGSGSRTSPCRSWRRRSPSPCCCARSGSPTSPT